jgi:phosphomannomutase
MATSQQWNLPNPEEPEAHMALALADKTNSDIVVGTDPTAIV